MYVFMYIHLYIRYIRHVPVSYIMCKYNLYIYIYKYMYTHMFMYMYVVQKHNK